MAELRNRKARQTTRARQQQAYVSEAGLVAAGRAAALVAAHVVGRLQRDQNDEQTTRRCVRRGLIKNVCSCGTVESAAITASRTTGCHPNTLRNATQCNAEQREANWGRNDRLS